MLHRTWQRLARIRRLGGGQADELGSGKGKGGDDEDGAQSLEAVVESARIGPVFGSDEALLRCSTEVDDDSEDDESDDGDDLNDRKDKLGFAVAFDTEQVEPDDQDEEDGDPDGVIGSSATPKFYRQ